MKSGEQFELIDLPTHSNPTREIKMANRDGSTVCRDSTGLDSDFTVVPPNDIPSF